MNTNSKHYELLAIEPWDIMEANFPPKQFIAYLKGNIIKYTLRDKGQALTDAQKIKHYAEKLIEVLEEKETEDEEPKIEVFKPQVKQRFKVGDRVEIIGYDYHFKEGQSKRATVIKIGVPYSTNQYLLEVDEESKGWHATKGGEGIKCDNAWLVCDHEIKLLEPEPTSHLIPNLWYDASLYTVEKLKELLPVGTKVVVTSAHDNDRKVTFKEEKLERAEVTNITKRIISGDTRIATDYDCWYRRYFKIIE